METSILGKAATAPATSLAKNFQAIYLTMAPVNIEELLSLLSELSLLGCSYCDRPGEESVLSNCLSTAEMIWSVSITRLWKYCYIC